MCLVYIRGPLPLTFFISFLSDLIFYILSNSFILKNLGYLFSNRPIDSLLFCIPHVQHALRFVHFLLEIDSFLKFFYLHAGLHLNGNSFDSSLYKFTLFYTIYIRSRIWMEMYGIPIFVNCPIPVKFTFGHTFKWIFM